MTSYNVGAVGYRNFVVVTALCLAVNTGCAGYREIINLVDHLPEKEANAPHHQTLNSLKTYYFLPDPYAAIKDIPLIDGPASGGYAAGVNGWANFASIITLNGYGRKIILPSDSIKQHGVGGIIHELIHHIDDMCRDGELKLLDLDEFRWAYLLMAHDRHYAGIVRYVEKRANNNWASLFGGGEMSEHIAYVAQYIATHEAPHYMKWVFRRILTLKYETTFQMTTINGKILDVDLTTK